MGNAIWIFLGIAILQAIVGGIAKSAEKRKKAEAARRMLEASKDGGGASPTGPSSDPRADPTTSDPPRVPAAVDLREKSNPSVRNRLEELRKKRLEVLRRRSGPDAGVTAAIAPEPPRTRAAIADPPPVAAPVTAPARGTVARAAVRAPQRPSTPNVQTTSLLRRESLAAGPDRQSSDLPAAKAVRPSSVGQAGSTAASLRRRLRTSKGFREALLLGELLKPPVGLRPPGGEPG
ncbi:MAG: hypothetical protein CMJ54_03355 [Planctomycetaceae bacterium]|nr:hypothetical protein [Planctomycetaceae bacterium]